MGMDSFAPGFKLSGSFLVKNISPQKKTISIFQYPINFGGVRDLLQIPGVSESSIRASLLKGELQRKILAEEIIILSNTADLIQFDPVQQQFLENAGINFGLQPVNDGYNGITEEQHKTLRDIIHFIDSGGGDGFTSGAVRQTLPSGSPFPLSIIWFLDNTLTTKLVEKLITYNPNKTPNTIVWRMYDTTGLTIIHTIIDTFSYTNNVFESTRTRTIL